MNILVIGGGGREHAIAWKLASLQDVSMVYVAPGNGGTQLENKCKNVDIAADDLIKLAKFAKSENIALTVVGPEVPLSLGIVDFFEANGLKTFGPCQMAAQLEASKSFAKDIMASSNIPTAGYKYFEKADAAIDYLKTKTMPIVVKADGLAAGKGVTIAGTLQEAIDAVNDVLVKHIFGQCALKVLIEDFLEGEEVSYLVMTDGDTIIPLAPAQDHKAAYDGDKGPNTGGMGAYSPASIFTDEEYAKLSELVIRPVLSELKKRDITYKGILYAGLMVLNGTGDKLSRVRVLEYNSRFGDPETQVILPRLTSDLARHMMAVVDGKLAEETLTWDNNSVATVVMASGGYPAEYETGLPITGLDGVGANFDIKTNFGVKVFHSGTKFVDSQLLTAGGRVLTVTGMGRDLHEALKNAYATVEQIHFDGALYRSDIGHRAL
ncbi:phosphoribosylamine--glycine ligase [Deferribacterales bacterium RsTz2092]|nr:phosphoribosylamine--glycine ligase [Deferribacterales bacterium]